MKRIRVYAFGAPEVLQLENADVPVPGPGQVLVRMKAAGVNPVDTYIRSGARPGTQVPYTPGLDGAGIIEQAGPGVEPSREGERVYTAWPVDGTYAQWALFESSQARLLPEALTFSQGAALHVAYATAHYALFLRCAGREGETVLVHGGSGGVGIAAIQWAVLKGMRVVATAGTAEGRALVLQAGAWKALDHHAADFAGQLLEATGGRGADVVLEMLANVNLGKDFSLLAPRGRIAVIGSRGSVEITPRDLMGKGGVVHGIQLFHATPQEQQVIHEDLARGIQSGGIVPRIGHELPLAEAARAHELILQPGARGKVVLLP
jgi:NADPH2:quinone reductase